MSIGIIGAGNIGLAVAKTLSRAGIAATIANSRGPDSLEESVAALGPTIKAGTREQAASADIVLIAVNWSKLPAAMAGLPAWGGRIVIDANNPIEAPLFKPVDLHGLVSSQVVADLVSRRAPREGIQPSEGGHTGERSTGGRWSSRAVLLWR